MHLAVRAVRPSTGGIDPAHAIDIDLVLQNQSDKVFTYRGGSPSQPVFSFQYLTEVARIRPMYIMCGTGLRDVSLAPGETVALTVSAHTPNRLQRVRIGIASTTDRFILWSPIIDPATGHFGPSAD